MTRTPGGKLLVWTNVAYDGSDVFGKPKQLNSGATSVKLCIGKDDAEAAGIPSGPDGICKKTGATAGIFERKVFAFDAAGKEVELATISGDADGTKVVTPCSAAALASVVRLGLALKGKGADTRDKIAALKRFSITLASAPAAAEDKEEEGAEDEEEGGEIDD